jgi:hypothetical protein
MIPLLQLKLQMMSLSPAGMKALVQSTCRHTHRLRRKILKSFCEEVVKGVKQMESRSLVEVEPRMISNIPADRVKTGRYCMLDGENRIEDKPGISPRSFKS